MEILFPINGYHYLNPGRQNNITGLCPGIVNGELAAVYILVYGRILKANLSRSRT